MKYPSYYEFKILQLNSLEIDERYQRDVQRNSRYIGKNFDPLAANAIIVGVRKNGKMFITDGLQRYTGAKIAGYTEIPALIFKSSGHEQEAKLFAMLNGEHRIKVTGPQNFKAKLLGKDKDAITINKVLSETGFQFTNGHDNFLTWPILQSIRLIETIYKDSGKEGLKTILLLIKELWEQDANALRGPFLKGFWLFYVEATKHINFNLKIMKNEFIKNIPIDITRAADLKMIEKPYSRVRRDKFIQLELLEIYNKKAPKEAKIKL